MVDLARYGLLKQHPHVSAKTNIRAASHTVRQCIAELVSTTHVRYVVLCDCCMRKVMHGMLGVVPSIGVFAASQTLCDTWWVCSMTELCECHMIERLSCDLSLLCMDWLLSAGLCRQQRGLAVVKMEFSEFFSMLLMLHAESSSYQACQRRTLCGCRA